MTRNAAACNAPLVEQRIAAEEARRADLERHDADAATPAPHDDDDPALAQRWNEIMVEATRRLREGEPFGDVLDYLDAQHDALMKGEV